MPLHCCVPKCFSNYKSKSKDEGYVRTFKFPKNEEEKKIWIKSIPRTNLTVTEHTVVCIKHWPEDAKFKTIRGGKQRPAAAPSVFPNIPSSCWPSNPAPKKRSTSKSSLSVRSLQEDEIDKFCKKDAITYEKLVQSLQSRYDNLIV